MDDNNSQAQVEANQTDQDDQVAASDDQGQAQADAKQTGTVKWFNTTKGFGFIDPDEGDKDLFSHVNELVKNLDPNDLQEGTRVEFNVTEGNKGPQAVDVDIAE